MASALSNMLTVLCSFLSVTVIIACLVLKVPQIFRVLKEKSSKGLSMNSVLLELCAYTIMLTYHCAMSYPLSTYLEYCFLVPQDLILLSLVLHLKGNLTTSSLPFLALYAFLCYVLAFRLVPDAVLTTCISLVTPVSVSSKLVQIVALLRSQDAGAVSAATWALATYGTLARSITTLVQTGDLMVLLNFAISFLLNSTMTTLIVIYQFKKPKDD